MATRKPDKLIKSITGGATNESDEISDISDSDDSESDSEQDSDQEDDDIDDKNNKPIDEETEEADENEPVENEYPDADSNKNNRKKIQNNIENDAYDDDCMYNFKGQKNNKHDDDDYDIELYDDDDDYANTIINNKDTMQIVDSDDRITRPILTKYERVRIICDRTKQLELNAKVMLKNVDHLSPKEKAQLELTHKVIPFIIERMLPDGKKEHWKLSELEILN